MYHTSSVSLHKTIKKEKTHLPLPSSALRGNTSWPTLHRGSLEEEKQTFVTAVYHFCSQLFQTCDLCALYLASWWLSGAARARRRTNLLHSIQHVTAEPHRVGRDDRPNHSRCSLENKDKQNCVNNILHAGSAQNC